MIKSRPSQRSRGQVIDLFPKGKKKKRKSSCGFRFFFVVIPRALFLSSRAQSRDLPVISTNVERSLHALRLVEMTLGGGA